jgi:hypothetical protein
MNNRKIIRIDVGNIPIKEVEEFMDSWTRKVYNLGPRKTKWQRFKSWLYNVCDTIGIAGSFGGF